MLNTDYHKSVLLTQSIDLLGVKRDGLYIDATLGDGGHTEAILQKGGKVIALDRDPDAIRRATERLARQLGERLTLVCANFADLFEVAGKLEVREVDGVLFDLGVSSYQIETPSRGFSFASGGPLDMRMNQEFGATAKDLVNGLARNELYEIFKNYGQEKFGGRIADAIVRARRIKPIETTVQLVGIIESIKKTRDRGKIAPATKVFQALRIAVNDELGDLTKGLLESKRILRSGGRLVVISFHELEDRIVKNFMKDSDFQIVTKDVVFSGREEVEENRRARSARLRAAQKI